MDPLASVFDPIVKPLMQPILASIPAADRPAMEKDFLGALLRPEYRRPQGDAIPRDPSGLRPSALHPSALHPSALMHRLQSLQSFQSIQSLQSMPKPTASRKREMETSVEDAERKKARTLPPLKKIAYNAAAQKRVMELFNKEARRGALLLAREYATRPAFERIYRQMKEEFPRVPWSVEAFAKKYTTEKERYRAWKTFMQQPGAVYNKTTGLFEASEELWKTYLKQHPDHRWLRTVQLGDSEIYEGIFHREHAIGPAYTIDNWVASVKRDTVGRNSAGLLIRTPDDVEEEEDAESSEEGSSGQESDVQSDHMDEYIQATVGLFGLFMLQCAKQFQEDAQEQGTATARRPSSIQEKSVWEFAVQDIDRFKDRFTGRELAKCIMHLVKSREDALRWRVLDDDMKEKWIRDFIARDA